MSDFLPLPADDIARAFAAVGDVTWRSIAGRRLFITGGTGFVGKWLLATLLHANNRLNLGCDVTVLTRAPTVFGDAVPELAYAAGVTLLRGDVIDFAFPKGQFDLVVHAATDVVAQNSPLRTFSTCVDGTRNALAFAAHAGASDFLLLSSGAVYGQQPPDLDRLSETYAGAPDVLRPASAYGEGKRVSEWLSCAHAAESTMRVKIARCFAFVGPYLPLDKQFAIGNFLRDALAGDEIVIVGDGTPYRTYLYAADMAAWLWTIALLGRSGVAYNVGGAEAISIAGLARRVVDVVGSRAGMRTLKSARAGYRPERYVPDVSRIRTELGLPEPLSLTDAIARTANWLRKTRAS